MDENSYLNPTKIKEQCQKAISNLNKDNEAMHVVEGTLLEFINDDELTSEAYETLKIQISDYQVILQAMRSSNDCDIHDFNLLNGMVGDEVLIGSNIISQEKAALSAKEDDENSASEYTDKAKDTIWPWMEAYYNQKASHYRHMAELDQQLYEKWKAKEDTYDEIESNTSVLFASSKQLRDAAKSGLLNITGAFQNGSYVPNLDADWRNALTNSYYDRLLIVEDDGTINPNWSEVEKVMQKDADDITSEEYNIMAFLYLNISEDDMGRFLKCCMTSENIDFPVYNEIFGYSVGLVNKDYSKWTVDKKKIENIQMILNSTADYNLLSLQSIDSKTDSELYKIQKEKYRQTVQRQTLLDVVKNIETFNGEYEASKPNISIELNQENSLVLKFNEFRNIGSEASPTFSYFGESTVTVQNTKNGINNKYNVVDESEKNFYARFGDVNELRDTLNFTSREVQNQMIGKGSEKLSSYIVEKTSKEALGKAAGYIPVVGDIVIFGYDMVLNEEEAKQNNDFIEGQFDSIEAAMLYSDFGCSTSIVEYDIANKKDTIVYAYIGEDTQEIVDRVNNKMNTDFNVQDVICNPNKILSEKNQLFNADPENEDLYEEAINDK